MRTLVLLTIFLTFAVSAPQKQWKTKPSPLLLRELQEVTRQNSAGGKTAIRVYSQRERRFEATWNDTVGISYHKSIAAFDGDTILTLIWIDSLKDFAATTKLSDSLFAHVTAWYNKEAPSAPIAQQLLSRTDAPAAYVDRLRYFSKALQGTPYFLGPTGEGRYGDIEPLPIFDLSRFDCVTFIESSIGLALSHHPSELLPAILPLRYHGDSILYSTRNHYFVGDWLGNNAGRFKILRLPGDTLIHKTLAKGKLLSAKGLAPIGPDPVADIAYLPYAKAVDLAAHWNLGRRLLGIAFVTHIEGLDVTHTGFIDSDSGKPLLRHAGQLKGRVVEQDFSEYLETRRGKCAGILLFEFLPPPAGG